MNTSPRPVAEADFASHDGARLHYRHWPALDAKKRALIFFHRGHEHSGRWQETVENLALPDFDVFAGDARGHGASPGERGSAEHIGILIRDVDAFVRHISKTHGIAIEDMIVVAHSVGAVIAAAWVHDFAPPIRGMVLATPAFRVRLYVPLAVPALRLKQKFLGPGFVKSYVKAHMLTHDAKEARRYAEDPLIFPQIAVNMLLDLHDTGTRLVADAAAIRVPTLMFSSGLDWVVENKAQREFYDRLSSHDKTLRLLPGFHHAIFHERGRDVVIDDIREFVTRLFSAPPAPLPSLRDADRHGFTRTEFFENLDAPNTLAAQCAQFAFNTIGRLSEGIALGLQSGFDSGETLDYVYENHPRGFTLLGEFMDRAYLESPGWSGIRMRRKHLEEMLRDAMRELHAAGNRVHILDAACGGGRYVLETLAANRDIPATALLRDYKKANLVVADKLRVALKLDGVKIVQADAFDRESFASLDPLPTIGIVSGLLELFTDNDSARKCLAGFAAAIEPGGVLIYTGQPWHPQLRFIAGVLKNREGRPWVMRRRTQAEIDELVRDAGFEKETQAIDPWGIFTVSRAARRAVKRPWLAAAGTVIFTGLLFDVAYFICNWLTGHRSDIGVWAFSWEQLWPVIPVFIVPYWSEDLIFIIAPFLCRTREEVVVHRKRIVFSIVASCLCFLLIPLRFAFPRPHVTGFFAPLFGAIQMIDLPHNLFPSLHIALRILLASVFLRVFGGSWRWLIHTWFALITVSTLVTWQHHLVDVLGGFWLGLIALHLFRFDEKPALRASNRVLAIGYALLAIACSQIARILWPWTFPFVWPAFAFGVGAFGYAGFGAGIYRKTNGRLDRQTKALLGPLLFLQWLSLFHYRKKSPRWSEVTPRVWIGALPDARDARDAIARGVASVLDLTVEFSESAPFLETRYRHLPVLDLTAPTPAQLDVAAEFIERESARGIVFVHCKAGYSRSAGAIGAWLLKTRRATDVDAVVAQLESARPGIVIRPEIRAALRSFGESVRV